MIVSVRIFVFQKDLRSSLRSSQLAIIGMPCHLARPSASVRAYRRLPGRPRRRGRSSPRLATQHPNADTELHFPNAYELLVATILSAQCTDERVNQVTPALFKRYPDARALARATTAELEPQIQSTGFFRAKSRSLLGMATEVVEPIAAKCRGRWTNW